MNGGTIIYYFKANMTSFDNSVNQIGKTINNVSVDSSKSLKSMKQPGAATAAFLSTVFNKAFETISSSVTEHIGDAVSRIDTLNNFPKVMSNFGVSAGDATKMIDKLDKGVQGLPTSLDSIASLAQSFVPVTKNTDMATNTALALNNALIAGGAGADVQSAALEQFRQALSKGKPELEDWRALEVAMPAQLQQVASALGLGSGAMSQYSKTGQGLYDAMKDGKLSMDDFNNALVGLNENGINGLPNFATQAKNASGGIQTSFTNMGTAITRVVAEVIKAVSEDTITNAAKAIGDGFKVAGDAIVGVINFVKANSTVFTVLAAAIGGVVAALTLIKVATTAYTVAQTLLNAVISASPLKIIISIIAAVVAALGVLQAKFNIFGVAWDFIKGVWGGAVAFFQGIWDGITSAVGGFISNVGNFFSGLWNGIMSGVNAVINTIRNVFGAVVGFINNVIVRPIAGFFSGLWNGITSGVNAVVNGVKNVFNSIVGFIKAPFNGIIGAINSVIKTINGIKIPDWVPGLGGMHTNFPTIPKLAMGGIVNTPTIAMLGEAGAEAVMPLENNLGWLDKLASEINQRGGGGGKVEINNSYEVNTNADVTLISREQARLMRRLA